VPYLTHRDKPKIVLLNIDIILLPWIFRRCDVAGLITSWVLGGSSFLRVFAILGQEILSEGSYEALSKERYSTQGLDTHEYHLIYPSERKLEPS